MVLRKVAGKVTIQKKRRNNVYVKVAQLEIDVGNPFGRCVPPCVSLRYTHEGKSLKITHAQRNCGRRCSDNKNQPYETHRGCRCNASEHLILHRRTMFIPAPTGARQQHRNRSTCCSRCKHSRKEMHQHRPSTLYVYFLNCDLDNRSSYATFTK